MNPSKILVTGGSGFIGSGLVKALVKAGHRVVGLDTSTGMLARFRVNLPGTPVVRGDVRNCPFSKGSIDAAVSWGMMFHLPRGDQTAALDTRGQRHDLIKTREWDRRLLSVGGMFIRRGL